MTTATVEETLQQITELEQEIKDAETKRDESIDFHQNKIELAKRICEIDTREAREEIARLSYSLECYYRDNPPKKGKSIKFSGGTIGYRRQSPKYYFNGEEVKSDTPAFVDYVRKFYDEYLKTKEYVDWQNFKAALTIDDAGVYYTETGEVLDGLTAQILPDSFKVTTNG